MSVVYVLAHFDDEYCALPLIWQAAEEGLAQRFIYLADYADPRVRRRRLAETCAFLARQGIAAPAVEPLGSGAGALDGRVHEATTWLYPRLEEAVRAGGPVTRLVTPAWEGGHMDHDACAFMSVRLASRLGVRDLRQFSLYHARRAPPPLLRAASPLPENGPVTPVRLSKRQWLRWMAAVRAFPSQAYAWSGIWPAMFGRLLRRGYGWQALAPERVLERPHAGRLFYERRFGVAYAEVRAALDAAGRD